MKKPFFITLGVAILLIALGIWLYLFLFGTPNSSDDVFADLGFDISSQPTVPIPQGSEVDNSSNLINVAGQPLRQLTLRPVAGFGTYMENEVLVVRYMERGTGHIYDINTSTGVETRVSNTTQSRVTDAVFGTTAEYVAFQSENGYNITTSAGKINADKSNGSISVVNLPPQASNLAFTGKSSVHYTLTNSATTGYEFDIINNNQRELFRVPFLSIKSTVIDGTSYLYNRQAPELLGTLYKTNGQDFNSLLTQKFGFSSLVIPKWYIYSYTENNTFKSEAVTSDGRLRKTLPLSFIPEKCTDDFFNEDTIFCAAPFEQVPYRYQKSWYQGDIRSNDALWEVDILSESSTLLTDPVSLIGREIDVLKMKMGIDGSSLLLINKNDDTLWYYDLLSS